MTVSIEACKVTVQGNGAITSFSYGFLIPVGCPYQVIFVDTSGNQSDVTSAVTITGLGNPNGGTFAYNPGAPISAGATLTLIREYPYAQDTELGNQTNYYPQAVEGGLDDIVLQVQQLWEKSNRSIFGPVSDGLYPPLPTATERAGGYLGFDQNGLPTVLEGTGGAPADTQDLYMFCSGLPSSSQLLTQVVFNRAITFPANFAGSSAYFGSAPTAAVSGNVIYQGITVGSVNFAIGSQIGTFVLAVPFTTAAGGILQVVWQTATDATATNLSITLSGLSVT